MKSLLAEYFEQVKDRCFRCNQKLDLGKVRIAKCGRLLLWCDMCGFEKVVVGEDLSEAILVMTEMRRKF